MFFLNFLYSAIGVMAPSFGIMKEEIPELKKFIKNLECEKNIKVKVFSSIGRNGPFEAYSAQNYDRFLGLRSAILDNETEILWPLRGGMGASQVVYLLERYKTKLPTKKTITGFSDATSLLLWADAQSKGSMHGPIFYYKALSCVDNKATNKDVIFKDVVDEVLKGKISSLNLKVLSNPKNLTKIPGTSVIGGNLAILHSNLGTPTAMQAKDRIVLIEDVEGNVNLLYKIFDGMVKAGAFRGVKALVIGSHVNAENESMNAFIGHILSRLKSEKIPVFLTNEVGHGSQNKLVPMRFKTDVEICGSEAVMSFDLSKTMQYKRQRVYRPVHRLKAGKIDSYDLLSLNGKYRVYLTRWHTIVSLDDNGEEKEEVGVRLIRHLVNMHRAGNFDKSKEIYLSEKLVAKPEIREEIYLIIAKLLAKKIVWV